MQPYADNQQVFDLVAAHLMGQGCQSDDGAGGCLYRGPEMRRCAVGALIPDSLYTPHMEGKTVDQVLRLYPQSVRPLFGNVSGALLLQLQDIHDNCRVEEWLQELTVTARTWLLNTNALTECDLYIEWEELVEAGECDESFEDWYSGICSDAYDGAKDRQDDIDMEGE